MLGLSSSISAFSSLAPSPLAAPAEPSAVVAPLSGGLPAPVVPDTGSTDDADSQAADGDALDVPRRRFLPRSSGSRRHEKIKPIKMGEHHYDWLWELVGLLIAVAIALIVFFSVPMIVTP
jgi:hypothetical protein